MFQKTVKVNKATGLHARPGSDIAELALSFEANITLIKGKQEIDAKEVLDVLAANINYQDEIVVQAEGSDEQIAGEAIAQYIESEEA